MRALQVLGLCRFSYPATPDAFNHRATSLEQVRATLYDRERLAHRLFLFEHVCLPGLRAQTDQDFRFLLLVGEHLPGWCRNRLEQLAEAWPCLRVVARPEGMPLAPLCREVMLAHRDPEANVVAEFRHDDDDAVAVDFVRTVRATFRDLRPLFRRRGRLVLSFTKGVVAHFTADDVVVEAVMQQRFWALGLTHYFRIGDRTSFSDFRHVNVWTRSACVLRQERLMFVRSSHATNDSNAGRHGIDTKPLIPCDVPDLESRMRTRFGIDVARLRNRWDGARAGTA